jgi:predicted transposase YdaD
MAEGKAEMIRNLQALGLSIDQLSQASQLSVEEVSDVLKKF